MKVILLCVGVMFVVTGCGFFQRAGTAATSPREDTGQVPLKEILANLPKATTLDPTAIQNIMSDLLYIILAGAGIVGAGTGAVALQVRSYKNLRADGVPVTSEVAAAPPDSVSVKAA